MEEVRIKIPNELKELLVASRINWQLALERRIKEELSEIVRLKKIVSKSQLTEEDVQKLSDETNIDLSEKYESLLKEER